jgi:hypothetical protein
MDTQSPAEVRNFVEDSDDFIGMCEMPGATDREVLCIPLKKDRRMSPAQIRYLAMLPRHQLMVLERQRKVILIKRIMPPRTRSWKQGHGNFETEWRKAVDKWINVEPFIDFVNREKEMRLYELERALENRETAKIENKIEKMKIKNKDIDEINKIKKEISDIDDDIQSIETAPTKVSKNNLHKIDNNDDKEDVAEEDIVEEVYRENTIKKSRAQKEKEYLEKLISMNAV